jgi:hypothetical protein
MDSTNTSDGQYQYFRWTVPICLLRVSYEKKNVKPTKDKVFGRGYGGLWQLKKKNSCVLFTDTAIC